MRGKRVFTQPHLYESTEIIPLLYDAAGYEQKLDLTQERALVAHFQAKKSEIELKVMQGEFISIEEVVEEVSAGMMAMRAKLLALPTKAAPQIIGLNSHTEIFNTLQTFVYEALEELSSEYEEKPDDKRTDRATGRTEGSGVSGNSPG